MVDPTDMALHIGYEIDAMMSMALRIGTTNDATIENALLEAALVHCRNLAEFLVGKNRRGDDIVPEDVVAGWDPEAVEIPSAAVIATHKHLSHLTKTRIIDGQVGWEFPFLPRTILAAMHRFVAHCEAERATPAATAILRNHLVVADEKIRQADRKRTVSTPTTTTTTTAITTMLIGSTADDVLSLGDFT